MKQLLFILGTSLIVILFVVGGCGFSGYKNLRIFRWCFNGLPFVEQLPKILDHKSYLVMLQNNTELRASGGFLGSYAKILTTPNGVGDITVQDIYVPDGQLVGHVDPPIPIQQAFGQGWWKLRDANWDPDFQIAGEQVAWFFEQGNEKVDGLIAINLSLVKSWLEVLGEVKLIDYPDVVTSSNFTDLAQSYSEVSAFPGSTQKKDFLGAVGRALILKSQQASTKQLLQLVKLVFLKLKNGEILLWFKDSELQRIAAARHWTGELESDGNDYLYIVESNLGANKANCCIERNVIHKISQGHEQVNITWKNSGQFENPVKPFFWGGNYINYVRVVIPATARVADVIVNNRQLINKLLDNQYGIQEDRYEIETRGNLQIIGFWVMVPAGESRSASISYKIPKYQSLVVRRQPGIISLDYQLFVEGKLVSSKRIDNDVIIPIWTK